MCGPIVTTALIEALRSSVLEAVTEAPFPRKRNLCTRFATEISLRRDTEQSISCKFNPDEERNEEETDHLRFRQGQALEILW